MLHVQFLKGVPDREENSIEFLHAAHLKMSALYWTLTAAHLLDAFNQIYPPERCKEVEHFLEKCYKKDGGFAGNEGPHDSHLLFTLSAIQIMKLLKLLIKENYSHPSWFEPQKTVDYVIGLQKENGSFAGDEFGEVDTRFTYCAVATLSLLNRLDAVDVKLTRKFLNSCRNFDGGFGAQPGSESHGGNIFCCISALKIMQTFEDESLTEQENENLVDWLVWRQLPLGGLNGRPEKLPDVCYSWWILSALKTLNAVDKISVEALEAFILQCQDVHGGFADRPGDVADIFHTLFALTGLSLIGSTAIEIKNRLSKKLPEINPLYCLPESVI